MKRGILFALLCACTLPSAIAQEENDELTTPQPLPKIRTREIGIMNQMGGDNNGINMVGIQYKKWKNEHMGARMMLAYGNHLSFNERIVSLGSDTIVSRQTKERINLGIIGAGVEMQRHFYRKFYLFAAVELRGGYGGGQVDTATLVREYTTYHAPMHPGATPFLQQNVRMTYIGLNPSVGIKIQTNRIVVGLEMIPAEFAFISKTYDKGSTSSIGEFNLGIFQHRFFINYRF